jgi:hypothetical protein
LPAALELLAYAVSEVPPVVERDELEQDIALRPLGMSALDRAPGQPDDAGAQAISPTPARC